MKILLSLLVSALWAAAAGTATDAVPAPTALELLDRYAATQAKLQSYHTKTTIREAGGSNRESSSEVWYDGQRARRCSRMWGGLSTTLPIIKAQDPYYQSRLWDGERLFQFDMGPARTKYDPHGLLTIMPKEQAAATWPGWAVAKTVPESANYLEADHHFLGKYYGDPDRVDVVLRQATKLVLRPRLERLNSSDCYVVEGSSRYGHHALWLDPQHGYHIAQAIIDRAGGDWVVWPNEYQLRPRERLHFEWKNVRFAQVQGFWVPMEADMVNVRSDAPSTNLNGTVRNHVQRTQFVLNPDHEALRSFQPTDIVDGAVTFIIGVTNARGGLIECRWKDERAMDRQGTVRFDSGLKEIDAISATRTSEK